MYNYNKLKSFGKDVFIAESAALRKPHLISIGSYVAIDDFVVITTQATIGSFIHIAPHISIIGGEHCHFITDDFVTIGAGSRFILGSEKYDGSSLMGPTVPEEYRITDLTNIKLNKFVSIATNVVVSSGVTIGEGCAVGANSFVNKDLEPWTVYVGNPAKPLKSRKKDMIELAKKLLENPKYQ